MIRLVAALLATAFLCLPAAAQTYGSGFNPRYSSEPDNPDQPDYRPADRPRPTYEFMIDASPGLTDEAGAVDDDDPGQPNERHRRRWRHRP